MKICLIGGIYGASQALRQYVTTTPEITLENGLRARGHKVTTLSHYDSIPNDSFDIIHVHHLSWGAVRAASCANSVPLVFTTHDPYTMSGLLPALRRRATEYVVARADGLIALSQTEALFQRGLYDLRNCHHAVIPNGIDNYTFSYRRCNHAGANNSWNLLYVGQLNQLKCVDVLLRAIAICGSNVTLRLAFHIDSLRSELERLCSQLGIAERVLFMGPQPPQALARLYSEADIFLLPSMGEALPTVITEAMSCGTPIIATDVGGVREQLHGFGLVVSPGSVAGMAQAIRTMIACYEHYSSQGEAMSRTARQCFSIESMIDQHLDVYEALLHQGPRRRALRLRRAETALADWAMDLALRKHHIQVAPGGGSPIQPC